MKIGRGISILVVVALLAGGLAGCLDSNKTASADAMTIPYYKLGDSYKLQINESYGFLDSDGEWEYGDYSYYTAVEINGTVKSMDRYGNMHDCFLLIQRYGESSDSLDDGVISAIDLKTKDMISEGLSPFRWLLEWPSGTLGLLEPLGLARSRLCGNLSLGGSYYYYDPPPCFVLTLQGEKIGVGDEIIREFTLNESDGSFINYSFSFRCVGSEVVGKQNCLKVNLSINAPRLPWNRTSTMYFAGEYPVPVMTTLNISEHGKYWIREEARLTEYKFGDKEIPFGECSAEEHYQNKSRDAQFPKFEKIPRSGETELLYDIHEAVKSVEDDLTLSNFQSWRSAHPDAYVWSAFYSRDGNDYTWRLQYTYPSPGTWNSYLVVTTRQYVYTIAALVSIDENEDFGECDVQSDGMIRSLTKEELSNLYVCSFDDALKVFKKYSNVSIGCASFEIVAFSLDMNNWTIWAHLGFAERERIRDTDLPIYTAELATTKKSGMIDLLDGGVMGFGNWGAVSCLLSGLPLLDIDPPES